MRLYLVRHPKPMVDASVCYGSSDIAVIPHALDQAVRGLTASVALGGLPRGLVMYSSPLRRCADLAQGLAGALDCASLVFDERLAEMDFGCWELCNWDDIPRGDIDAWADDLAMYCPGGGESVIQMAARVQAFYDDVLVMGRDAIVVCHAGTIRMLLACQGRRPLLDVALHAARHPMQIGYGEVVIVASD